MFAFLRAPAYRVEFERLLEACGFRITILAGLDGFSDFESHKLKLGDRVLKHAHEMNGWRIAYRLERKADCCRKSCLYRLARPYVYDKHENVSAGLGPAVCAKCGRIERDYDDLLGDDNRLLFGKATNAFPVLDALMRSNEAYTTHARLALLRRERRTLEERRAVIDLEIAQLEARVPTLAGDGPYRAALSDPPDDRAKTLPALTEGS